MKLAPAERPRLISCCAPTSPGVRSSGEASAARSRPRGGKLVALDREAQALAGGAATAEREERELLAAIAARQQALTATEQEADAVAARLAPLDDRSGDGQPCRGRSLRRARRRERGGVAARSPRWAHARSRPPAAVPTSTR